MQLLGYINSRVTYLFRVVPGDGQPYLPKAVHALVERYGFVGYPTNIAELTADAVSFRHGAFNEIAIDTLEIFSDGVVVSSRANSSVLDEFLQDLVGFAEDRFRTKVIALHKVNKMYESHVLVKANKDLFKRMEWLAKLQNTISKNLKSDTSAEIAFAPFALTLAADILPATSLRPTAFRLERKVDLPFEDNYYVSSAPLTTENHLSALQLLENTA